MKTQIKLITPKMAQSYLLRNISNRPLRDKIVRFYANQMKRGQWQLTGQGISFDENNNLLDGQHRLAAIIKSNIELNMLVITGIDSSSFSVYDTGKTRTASDIFNIENIKNATVLSASIRAYLIFCIEEQIYSQNRVKDKNITNQDILNEYYLNQSNWDLFIYEAQKNYSNLRLFTKSVNASITAFLIMFLNHNENDVFSFFRQLFETETTNNYGIKLLRKNLIKNALANKKYSLVAKKVLLAKTWNAYILRNELKFLRYNETEKMPNLI